MTKVFKIVLAVCLLATSANAVTVYGNSAQLNAAGSLADCGTAGTASGINAKAVTLALPPWANSAEVEVTGTFVATWSSGGSTDGINYRAQQGQSASTFSGALGSSTIGSVSVFGTNTRFVCVFLSAYTSGAVGVVIEPRVSNVQYLGLATGGGTGIATMGTSSSIAQGAANSSAVSLLTVQAATIGINSTPAVNTQASASVAAGGATVIHMGASCSGSINTVAAQPGLTLSLRDGATGAGTVLWSATINCAISSPCTLASPSLNVKGTAATAMTCEWSGIPAVGNFEIANLEYKNAS